MLRYTGLFYKQSVYKQLAIKWQIAKQLSGRDPLSLKVEFFLWNKPKKAVKLIIHQNSEMEELCRSQVMIEKCPEKSTEFFTVTQGSF